MVKMVTNIIIMILEKKIKSIKRQRGGGSLMIWGALRYKGTFHLVVIDSTLKAVDFIELLSNYLFEQTKKKSAYDFIFQHDNASINNSVLYKKILEQ